MTELFNFTNDHGSIPWSPPAPLHVAMVRDAIKAFRDAENAKDEARKHLLETKA